MGKFTDQKAVEINEARLSHLGTLGLPLHGRRVLEVGAGIGKLTRFFEDRDCDVISTDARESNMRANLKRHPWRKEKVLTIDLETLGSHAELGRFDVIFCYGVLYHLTQPAFVIGDLAKLCDSLFLLETRVNPVDNGRINPTIDGIAHNESLAGLGCQPARDWVMANLRKHFGFVYLTKTQPNHLEYPTSWPAQEERARAIFVASRSVLELESLSEELLMKQGRQ